MSETGFSIGNKIVLPTPDQMNRYKYTDTRGEHLHTLDGKPLIGTSRVGDVLAKPLTWWASGLAVQVFGCPDPKILTKIKNKKATKEEIIKHQDAMALALSIIQGYDVAQYAALIDKAYRAHQTTLKDKAVAGTDLHAECERFVKDWMADGMLATYDLKIQPFVDWTKENVKRFLWSEGHCYSEKHWLGGISDVGYETHDGKLGVLDFKSSKEAYMGQLWQCAGYAIQIEENGVFDADGNQIYSLANENAPRLFDEVCVFAFGAEKPKPQFNYDMAGSKEAFLAELTIYNKLPQD